MKRGVSMVAVAALLSGCVSSLAVQPYKPGTAQVGYPYRLRLTQYQVTLTWRVTACDPAAGPNRLKIKMSAETKETTALDPEQFYVIDPRSLQGLFRTTEFTMEWYEDRTPKSITSDIDDQTGVAIGNVLQGVAKLAAVGLAPAGAGPVACSKDVTDALAAINGVKGDPRHPGQKAVTEKAQKAVDDQTATLTAMNAAATTMGAMIDNQTRRNLGQARAHLEALTAVLAIEQAKLKELNDVLTDTKTVTWPETGSDFASTEGYKPSKAAATRWNLDTSDTSAMMFLRLTPLDEPGLVPASAPVVATPVPAPAAPPAADGVPDLGAPPANPPAPAPAPPPTPAPSPVTPAVYRAPKNIPGLPYREPGRVRLDICRGGPCDGTPEQLDAADRLVATTKGLALQAGTMMYLPFRAQTFAHIKNSAGFAQSGVLTSAGTSQLRGAGTGVTEAIKTGGEQVGAIVDADRAATTKRLNAAADEAKARKALADAEAALKPAANADALAQIAAFQTEATLASAEKSKLDAQAALAATKATLGQ